MGVKGAIIGGVYVPGDISLSEGVVDAIGLPPGDSGLAIPGFVDLQVNGFGGIDLIEASVEQWEEVNRGLARTGVSAYLANLVTNDQTAIDHAIRVAREVQSSSDPTGSHLAGVHLEGPFLSDDKAGIHSRTHLKNPVIEMAQQWVTAGPVAMMTLAPELPGALELIESLVQKGVLVSLGHSNSTADEALAGFNAGASTVTHIFNAMSGITARSPGLAGAALSRGDVWIQLILDYLHVDRLLAEVLLAFAPHRIVLVTDCLPVTGTVNTHFTLAGVELDLIDGKAVNHEGVLAGSVLTMDQALRNAVACGMSDVDAVNATSLNPLRVLNPSYEGPLVPGAPADVLIVSDSWDLKRVFRDGIEIEELKVG